MLTKQGPKRRRRTRRELPYGQVRRWGATTYHFKDERQRKLDRAERKDTA